MILLLETATAVCSVALADKGSIVAQRRSDLPNAHSSKLSLFIDDMFRQLSIQPSHLEAVCVSSGPGSYTGLRIGVSSAKGFCYALDIPLLAVPTLLGMASLYHMRHPDYDGYVCPMIDARRMECYTAFYHLSPHSIVEARPVSAQVISPGLFDDFLDKAPVVFVGDGAPKTRPLLASHPNAHYDDSFAIAAEGMLPIAIERLRQGRVEDVAYFEPFYLKDFVAKKSIVRGLRQ